MSIEKGMGKKVVVELELTKCIIDGIYRVKEMEEPRIILWLHTWPTETKVGVLDKYREG